MAQGGLMIAGLSSGSGKTLTTLGVMRSAKRQGLAVTAAKAGPDYIDTSFHQLALGLPSVNLDPFAMGADLLRYLASKQDGEVLIVEGVMGVNDGGEASSARLASLLQIPIVLVMDISGQAETSAAIACGVKQSLEAQKVALIGVILNNCASERHALMASDALKASGIHVFGAIPHRKDINIPSRHLGLVMANELRDADSLVDTIADIIEQSLPIKDILTSASAIAPFKNPKEALPPPAQRIAIASDVAFGFGYEHLLQAWQRQGATITPFSPLADEAPPADAEWIFLPGGYPELHLERLQAVTNFKDGMHRAAKQNIPIYGECGGYMVLGEAIVDKNGKQFPMLGLLEAQTSFSTPRLHLGYRVLECLAPSLLPKRMLGHEFHYTTATKQKGESLFKVSDKNGSPLGEAGLRQGSVSGSYMHIIAAP